MTRPKPSPGALLQPSEIDSDAVFAAVSTQLQAQPLPPGRHAALLQRLGQRVQASVQAHRSLHTVRREAGAWLPQGGGVTQRLLRQSDGLRVTLLDLPDGAAVPVPTDAPAVEWLVVHGGLVSADAAPGSDPLGYLVAAVDAQLPGTWCAQGATRLMARSPLAGHPLPALEAHWWAQALRRLPRLRPAQRTWQPNRPGVQVQALCGDLQVISMLVRFGPGAGVPDHGHALDEDCLMLSGEMYLGDVLLRPMDYQLARAGGGHFGEMSETGGSFYFHGALDPVLLPPG